MLSMKNLIFRLVLPAHYLLVLFDDQRMSRHPLPSPLMVANNKNLYNGFTTGTFNNQCHIKKIYLTIMFHKYIHATKPLVIHSTGCFISKSIFRLVCAFVTDLLPDSTFLPRFLHHVSLHPFTPAAWSHITWCISLSLFRCHSSSIYLSLPRSLCLSLSLFRTRRNCVRPLHVTMRKYEKKRINYCFFVFLGWPLAASPRHRQTTTTISLVGSSHHNSETNNDHNKSSEGTDSSMEV